jgi:phospholipase A1
MLKNGNILSFNGSHNLTFNSNSRGTPFVVLSSQFKRVFISHGYGESLIDYNNLQTTIVGALWFIK